MDAVREDMTAVDVTEEDAEERAEWRRRTRCRETLTGAAERRRRR